MYIIDNKILLTIIACNYVLLYIYYYLDARIESLRDTNGRLSYSQLKHVSRLEPSTKGAFEVSKHWHLRAIAFECRGYFRKNSIESIISVPLSYARVASNNSQDWLHKGERRLLSERNKRQAGMRVTISHSIRDTKDGFSITILRSLQSHRFYDFTSLKHFAKRMHILVVST